VKTDAFNIYRSVIHNNMFYCSLNKNIYLKDPNEISNPEIILRTYIAETKNSKDPNETREGFLCHIKSTCYSKDGTTEQEVVNEAKIEVRRRQGRRSSRARDGRRWVKAQW
jgi:hypothetical protein